MLMTLIAVPSDTIVAPASSHAANFFLYSVLQFRFFHTDFGCMSCENIERKKGKMKVTKNKRLLTRTSRDSNPLCLVQLLKVKTVLKS